MDGGSLALISPTQQLRHWASSPNETGRNAWYSSTASQASGVLAAKAAGMSVIWVPDPELLKTMTQEQIDGTQATQILTSLEDFKPEEWGLPGLIDVEVQ